MNDYPTKPSTLQLFRGPLVWSGIAFTLFGSLAETLSGGEMAFEHFMLYGGLFIGVGVERRRHLTQRPRPEAPPRARAST